GPSRLVIVSELRTPQRAQTEPSLDPRQSRNFTDEVLRPDVERVDGVRVIRTYRTGRSGLAVAAGGDHEVGGMVNANVLSKFDASRAHIAFEVDAAVGETVKLTKWLAYHYGPDDAAELADRAALTLDRARGSGHAGALADHQREVENFWERSEV